MLSIGLSYSSWDQAFIAIVDDSHAQCHAAPKAAKSNNSDRQSWYCYYREASDNWIGCEYRVYLRKSSDGVVVIKGLDGTHRCLGKPYPARVGMHSRRYLENKVSLRTATRTETDSVQIAATHLVTGNLRARTIAEEFENQTGVRPSLPSINLLKHSLAEDDREGQIESWARLPAYVSRLQQADARTVVELKTIGDGRISAIFICPSFSQDAFLHMRPFIAVDGAFTKTIHQYVLMLAVGFDANEHSVMLAWGFAMTESEDTWEWFLHRLRSAIPRSDSSGCVIISDRQKVCHFLLLDTF